jgi:hypothetical protein
VKVTETIRIVVSTSEISQIMPSHCGASGNKVLALVKKVAAPPFTVIQTGATLLIYCAPADLATRGCSKLRGLHPYGKPLSEARLFAPKPLAQLLADTGRAFCCALALLLGRALCCFRVG